MTKLRDTPLYLFRPKEEWPNNARLRRDPGVYEIVALDEDGRPKPLSRVGDVDERGVIYIGRSKRLRDRLGTLWRMIYKKNQTGHILGITYRKNPRIRAVAPARQIAFRFMHCANYIEKEDALLRSYFRKFGEVPPLNGRAEFITKTSV